EAGELLQHEVARRMAPGVVELLEEVDVVEREAEWIAVASRPFDLSREPLVEVLPVVRPGQGVGDREPVEARVLDVLDDRVAEVREQVLVILPERADLPAG